MTLRILLDYDPESCNWHAIHDFLDKILPEWDSDNIIIDLLTAIILFDANRPKLLHRESVKLQQQCYMYLLQRYLRLRYQSDCVSDTKFL
ncbi:unnamed protein product, partial [Oppiella nova]